MKDEILIIKERKKERLIETELKGKDEKTKWDDVMVVERQKIDKWNGKRENKERGENY